MPEPEELSREDLVALVRAEAERIAELTEANEQLVGKLARLEHLLSRNSGNSSMPPSGDDQPGRTPPKGKRKAGGGSKRSRGKQPGAPGSNLAWAQVPDERSDRFPTGRCECGTDLVAGRDLGVVDRYQQREIPLVAVKVTQYDQHAVACGCGRVHTAARPAGARGGPVGYGPNLQALCVYLLVVQFLPVGRVVDLLESLTGTAPSAGFVHGMLARAALLVEECDKRIAALLTLAYVVCADETPLRVGQAPGKKYLLVACNELYTHYLLGGRDLETFKAMVLTDLAAGSVIVHDRYQNYDAAPFAHLLHQLCTAHLLRDLEGVAELYPDEIWPTQITDALRGLIHEANAARDSGAEAIEAGVKDKLVWRFRQGVLVGLSDTGGQPHDTRPGARKARLLLEVLRDRQADVLRFAADLRVPATSNQAERDLRPGKIQQNSSGRLTSEQRTRDRYRILGCLSTAAKHGLNQLAVLRDAITGRLWIPEIPATT